jgi:uncharacterized caspase-like protein
MIIGSARILPITLVYVCALIWFAGTQPTYADTRVALVVGNSDYQYIPRLTNPTNDAKLIAETLTGLGFKLVGGGAQLDVNKAQFDQAVQDFGNAALNADVALFYYAGHGVQVNGANYLVPISANPTKQADVDFQMLDVNLVLRQMEGARTHLNIVVLDACRNNPFGGRGLRAANGGLAQIQAPEGTIISFATQPGNVAQDGADGDSPYSKALAKSMRKPGLDIFRTFNDVGLSVSWATNGEQQPWMSMSPITGEFHFAALPETPKPDPMAEQGRSSDAKDSRDVAADAASKAAAAAAAQREAKAAQDALERAARETAAAKAAQEAAKAAQLAAEKSASELQQALEMAKQDAAAQAAQHLKENQVAALTPGPTQPPDLLGPTDIVQLVKAHLREVGCDPGDLSGVWDDRARHALEQFNGHAGTKINVEAINAATLEAVRAQTGQVCPTKPDRKAAKTNSDDKSSTKPPASPPARSASSGSSAGELLYRCRSKDTAACASLCSQGFNGPCKMLGRLH